MVVPGADRVIEGRPVVAVPAVYGNAVVDLPGGLKETREQMRDIVLSFGYVPGIEVDHGLIQWLFQDPRAAEELEWVRVTAQCTIEERRRRLSADAVEVFEAMLDICGPRYVTA